MQDFLALTHFVDSLSTLFLSNNLYKVCTEVKCIPPKANIKDLNSQEEFYFNEKQAKIVEELYNSPNYELHVKTLLHEKLSLVLEDYRQDKQFKNHPNWRKLIMRTKKGYWRLNI